MENLQQLMAKNYLQEVSIQKLNILAEKKCVLEELFLWKNRFIGIKS